MMQNDILISIIVPVYNLQNDLERCVFSILSQSYKNLEIILINDGSTDKSWNIIQKLAMSDKRIVPISKSNGGVTSARFAGLRIAKGEYIGFVDGDDEIEPDMYEFLLKNILHYNADISHCGYQMMFDDGRVNDFYNTGKIVLQDHLKGLKDLLKGDYIEPGLWNKLFSKKLFFNILKKDLIDLDIRVNEDLLMNYYLFSESKKSIYQDVCKYKYMAKGVEESTRFLDEHKIFDPIRVKNIIIDISPQELKMCAWAAYIKTCISIYNMLILKGINRYHDQSLIIKEKLLESKNWWMIVGKKQKVLIWMILYSGFIYVLIYRFYNKFFINSRYD